MTTVAMRKKLHDYLDTAADKKIKAIYTMVEDELAEEKEDYSDEFKAELDRRYEEYLKDGITISRAEVNEQIKKIRGK